MYCGRQLFFGVYYLQILSTVGAPGPACGRSSGSGGRRCQGGSYKSLPRFGHLVLHVDEVQVVVDAAAKAAFLRSFFFFFCFVSFSSESITYKSSRRLGTWSCMSTTFRWWRAPLPRLLFLEPITYTSSPRLGHLGTWNM